MSPSYGAMGGVGGGGIVTPPENVLLANNFCIVSKNI